MDFGRCANPFGNFQWSEKAKNANECKNSFFNVFRRDDKADFPKHLQIYKGNQTWNNFHSSAVNLTWLLGRLWSTKTQNPVWRLPYLNAWRSKSGFPKILSQLLTAKKIAKTMKNYIFTKQKVLTFNSSFHGAKWNKKRLPSWVFLLYASWMILRISWTFKKQVLINRSVYNLLYFLSRLSSIDSSQHVGILSYNWKQNWHCVCWCCQPQTLFSKKSILQLSTRNIYQKLKGSIPEVKILVGAGQYTAGETNFTQFSKRIPMPWKLRFIDIATTFISKMRQVAEWIWVSQKGFFLFELKTLSKRCLVLDETTHRSWFFYGSWGTYAL